MSQTYYREVGVRAYIVTEKPHMLRLTLTDIYKHGDYITFLVPTNKKDLLIFPSGLAKVRTNKRFLPGPQKWLHWIKLTLLPSPLQGPVHELSAQLLFPSRIHQAYQLLTTTHDTQVELFPLQLSHYNQINLNLFFLQFKLHLCYSNQIKLI